MHHETLTFFFHSFYFILADFGAPTGTNIVRLVRLVGEPKLTVNLFLHPKDGTEM